MYDESAQQVGSNMMMSMDTEQYGDGDNYGDYEGQYGDHDQGYDVGGGGQEGVGTGERHPFYYCVIRYKTRFHITHCLNLGHSLVL